MLVLMFASRFLRLVCFACRDSGLFPVLLTPVWQSLYLYGLRRYRGVDVC